MQPGKGQRHAGDRPLGLMGVTRCTCAQVEMCTGGGLRPDLHRLDLPQVSRYQPLCIF